MLTFLQGYVIYNDMEVNKMDKNSLLKEIGYKLKKLREQLRYRSSEMADGLGAERTGYSKYEQGKTPPKLIVLYRLAEKFDVSLDWLIRGKGPMYYKQKETKEPDARPAHTDEINELLDHMEKIPLLHHEVLAFFLKFKEKNKDMVAKAFEEKG
jgi:transcriptional regulator with XRE-family HTH domain